MAGRRVLITGVGSHLGTLLAERLTANPEFSYVAGLDTRPPKRRPVVAGHGAAVWAGRAS